MVSSPEPVPQPASFNALPHVLLVVDQFPKSLGGGERIVLRLAALLLKQNYCVSILTFSIHPESALYVTPFPCPIYELPLQRTYGFSALRAAFLLKRFISEQKVRIVQTFFESSDLWAGLVVKTLSSAKLIWSRRDMGILRTGKHKLTYRLLSKMPDRVFTVSESVRRHAIGVDRVVPNKVETVYNGVDVASWPIPAHETERPSGFVIAALGNIRHVKGHDLLASAAAIVLQTYPHAVFRVAGEVLEPEFFNCLQDQIHTLGIADRFTFVFNVSDIQSFFSQADVFVLPSRSEGFSNAIIEAMAASLPVVATDVGGNAEAVENGRTGWIVPPEDPQALAEGIMRLLASPQRMAEMGRAGRTRAEESFSTQAMIRQVTAAYESLLERR